MHTLQNLRGAWARPRAGPPRSETRPGEDDDEDEDDACRVRETAPGAAGACPRAGMGGARPRGGGAYLCRHLMTVVVFLMMPMQIAHLVSTRTASLAKRTVSPSTPSAGAGPPASAPSSPIRAVPEVDSVAVRAGPGAHARRAARRSPARVRAHLPRLR